MKIVQKPPAKKVMCFGSFDILHEGHHYFITQSQNYGQKTFIVVARDENITKLKNKPPFFTLEVRIKNLKKNFPFATILPGHSDDFWFHIKKNQPEIICLGYDQSVNIKTLKNTFPSIKIKKIKAFYPEKFKSSLLRPD